MTPPNERGHLTRHQRQAQERLEESRRTQRRYLGIGGFVTTTLLAGGIIGYNLTHQPQPKKCPPLPVVSGRSNEQVLLNRGTCMVGSENAQETFTTWEGFSTISTLRMRDLVEQVMLRNSNPHFREAAQILGGYKQDTFRAEVFPTLVDEDGTRIPWTIDVTEGKNRPFFLLKMDNEETLQRNPVLLACDVVQMAHYIKQFLKEYDPTKPLTEQTDLYTKAVVFAKAKQSEAYLYAYGEGFRGGIGSSIHALALAYVWDGMNPNDPHWAEEAMKTG